MSKTYRMVQVDCGGEQPAIVQVFDGEDIDEALHRHYKACADRAREDGLGAFICDHCDRPKYICIRNYDVCFARQQRAAKTAANG